MANPVAQVCGIVVRHVLDRADAEPGTKLVGLGSPQAQDGVTRAGPHRRQTVGRGAAEHVEQDGLGLVVGGVTGSGTRRQGTEPR